MLCSSSTLAARQSHAKPAIWLDSIWMMSKCSRDVTSSSFCCIARE